MLERRQKDDDRQTDNHRNQPFRPARFVWSRCLVRVSGPFIVSFLVFSRKGGGEAGPLKWAVSMVKKSQLRSSTFYYLFLFPSDPAFRPSLPPIPPLTLLIPYCSLSLCLSLAFIHLVHSRLLLSPPPPPPPLPAPLLSPSFQLLPSFLPPSPAHPSNFLAVTPLVAHHPLRLSARLVSLSSSNPLPATVLSIDRALWLPPEVASPRLLPPVLPLPLRDRPGLHRQSREVGCRIRWHDEGWLLRFPWRG